jgi:hypothetical protein
MSRKGWRLDLVLLAVLANVVAVLAITQLGGEKVTVGPEAVAEAAVRTANTDGFRFSLQGEVKIPEVGPVSFTGGGAADLRAERGVMQVDMSDIAEKAGADGAFSQAGLFKMEMAFDRRYIYMKSPVLMPQLDGRSWMRFDLQRVAGAAGMDASFLRAMQQQGNDPASTLRYLRALSDRVEKLGTAEVRGVQTTHYRATVELRKVAELLPDAAREPARRSIEQLIELSGEPEMEMEIWVGQDRMIRRVEWSQSMKAPGTDQAVEATITSEYYDFGTKVSVEPPPEDDVRDVTDLMGGQLAL